MKDMKSMKGKLGKSAPPHSMLRKKAMFGTYIRDFFLHALHGLIGPVLINFEVRV